MSVPVARRNLFAEKGRFVISVAGVAFAVLLILTVLALYRGWSKTGQTFQELPGQLWIVQSGTSDPFHSISLIEGPQLEVAAKVPGVAHVVPVLQRQMTFHAGGENAVRLMALAVPPGFDVGADQRDRFLPEKGEIIIDKTLSRKTGLGEGDEAHFGDVTLTVSDVRSRSPEVLTPFAFVNFADAQRIFGVGDVVTYGIVVLEPGAEPQEVRAAIESQDGHVRVFTTDEFAKSIRKEIDETFIPVIIILVAIGFVVGAAVVGLTIYTATIERTREFGVMKAVGGSAGFLYRVVLSQSTMVTAFGFLTGVAASLAVSDLAARAVPEFATEFRAGDLAGVLGATMVMAIVASFIPVRRISSIDPAAVFRA